MNSQQQQQQPPAAESLGFIDANSPNVTIKTEFEIKHEANQESSSAMVDRIFGGNNSQGRNAFGGGGDNIQKNNDNQELRLPSVTGSSIAMCGTESMPVYLRGDFAMTQPNFTEGVDFANSHRDLSYSTSAARCFDASKNNYDVNSLMVSQRPSMYPYLHSKPIDELESHRKYFEQQEVASVLYPRAMYHYDASAGHFAAPPEFSAINLSLPSAFRTTPLSVAPSGAHALSSTASFPSQLQMSDSVVTSANSNSAGLKRAAEPSVDRSQFVPGNQLFSNGGRPQVDAHDFGDEPSCRAVQSRDSTPDSATSTFIDSCGKSPHPNYDMSAPPDFSSNGYPSAAATYSCSNPSAGSATNSSSGGSNFIGRNNIANSVVSAACSPYGITAIGYASVYGSPSCYPAMPPPQHLPQHEKSCTKDR